MQNQPLPLLSQLIIKVFSILTGEKNVNKTFFNRILQADVKYWKVPHKESIYLYQVEYQEPYKIILGASSSPPIVNGDGLHKLDLDWYFQISSTNTSTNEGKIVNFNLECSEVKYIFKNLECIDYMELVRKRILVLLQAERWVTRYVTHGQDETILRINDQEVKKEARAPVEEMA